MEEDRTQYTFTFDQGDEKNFNRIKSRLDPDEYTVDEEIHKVNEEDGRYSELTTKITMVPEAASTFRFGMKNVKIRRYRTEAEEAEAKAREDRNKVTINVKVDGWDGVGPLPPI